LALDPEATPSHVGCLLLVRTVSAAEEQQLLRYRWLSSGLSLSAAC
jgi:hypothetical protein